jgi:Plasmid pRiA4b ORF-3-like protein
VDEEPAIDARRTRLADVVLEMSMSFVCDFGDNWQHDIVVQGIGRPDPRRTYPLGIAGQRAALPEDCGGICGYTDLLALLEEGHGEECDEMLTWLGGDFDPASFDQNLVNRRLRQLR